MGYVSSGQFRADVERAVGEALAQPPSGSGVGHDDEDSLARFPLPLRAELEALRGGSLPDLCTLKWGDFCTVPELTGEERDDVLDDWFGGDEAATDFVMSAVDILNGGGGFYVVVHPNGRMGLVCEDPHSFDALDCAMPQFLQALAAAHQGACTTGLEAAKAALVEAVDVDTADLLLTFAERLTPAS